MDVPCPKRKCTHLHKVSLAYDDRLYQSDNRAQFRGVLVGSGGPGVLIDSSTTKGTKQRGLTAQSGEVGTCRICENASARLLSFETSSVIQISIATTVSRSSLVERQQNRVTGRSFRAES
jgi:hypothetical protein